MSGFTNEDTFFKSCLKVVDIMDCYKSTCMASNFSGMYKRVGCSGLRITPAQPTEAGGGKLFGAVSFAFVAVCRYWWDRLYFCSMLEPYVFDGHRMRLFWKQGCVPGARQTRSSDLKTQHVVDRRERVRWLYCDTTSLLRET
jgi:hypothetical protein